MKIRLLSFFIFFFLAGWGFALDKPASFYKQKLDSFENFLPKYYELHDSINYYDSLFGKNIKCDSILRPALIYAMSAYPELWENKLEVKFKNISTTMQARPGKWFLVKAISNRNYKIIVNKNNLLQALNIKYLGFDVQYGIFGHELAHFYEYSKLNALRLSSFGIKYALSKKYRKHIERSADLLALERGFAYSIFKLKYIMFFGSEINLIYQNKLKKYYLQLDEILDFIHQNYQVKN